MFGYRRKKATQQTIDTIGTNLAIIQRSMGIPPYFWDDEFVLGFFGIMISLYAKIITNNRLSQVDKGQLVVDTFSALSHMNGQSISGRYIELSQSDIENDSFRLGCNNGYICTMAGFGKFIDDGKGAVAEAEKMTKYQAGPSDGPAIAANLLLILLLRPLKERFPE